MRVLCVIPARGGSKSIPRKNIRPLNGRPLLDYSIKYAKACPLVDKVVVSTDDVEIAEIAKLCGAEIPFMRPAEYALDDTQDYPVVRHAIDFFDANQSYFDLIVLLRPTSPLRQDGLIEASIELLSRDLSATSVRSVALVEQHPYRMWVRHGDQISGLMTSNAISEPYNLPRQQLPEYFFQTGDIEVVRRSTILDGSISGKKVLPLVINQYVDIDTDSDFEKAKSIILGS